MDGLDALQILVKFFALRKTRRRVPQTRDQATESGNASSVLAISERQKMFTPQSVPHAGQTGSQRNPVHQSKAAVRPPGNGRRALA